MRSTEDNSKIFFFFFLNKNVCCDSSLDLSELDISVRGHKICLKELYGKLFLNYPCYPFLAGALLRIPI